MKNIQLASKFVCYPFHEVRTSAYFKFIDILCQCHLLFLFIVTKGNVSSKWFMTISISIFKALPVLLTALATLQLTRIDSNGKEGVYILVRIIGVVCGIN